MFLSPLESLPEMVWSPLHFLQLSTMMYLLVFCQETEPACHLSLPLPQSLSLFVSHFILSNQLM